LSFRIAYVFIFVYFDFMTCQYDFCCPPYIMQILLQSADTAVCSITVSATITIYWIS